MPARRVQGGGVRDRGERLWGVICAFGRVVERVGSGSRSVTCSLKWFQRVVTPVVAHVLMSSRMRCPSCSVQKEKRKSWNL